MSTTVVRCDQASKRFCHGMATSLLHGAEDLLRRLCRRGPVKTLRKDEFWALRGVSFEARRGECIGIIGPNGAGKSTLLKLINGDYRPDQGRIERNGQVTALIRLGAGLQPLLTGRENIYIQCAKLGFSKIETDALLERIVAFSGLEKSLDVPVKRYSDGMYARLEFSIATCAPMEILLIDEVLAVGDAAFQMRCLQRLEELKQAGSAILFVSHSEMHVRQIADRCLLLFDGEALALGETDAVFRKYYAATGLLDRMLEPLSFAPAVPGDFVGPATLTRVAVDGLAPEDIGVAGTGQDLRLRLRYAIAQPIDGATLVLQFWSSSGVLIGAYDSALYGETLLLARDGVALLHLRFLGLTAGVYRVAGGFRAGGRWLGYQSGLLILRVAQPGLSEAHGLMAIDGQLTF